MMLALEPCAAVAGLLNAARPPNITMSPPRTPDTQLPMCLLRPTTCLRAPSSRAKDCWRAVPDVLGRHDPDRKATVRSEERNNRRPAVHVAPSAVARRIDAPTPACSLTRDDMEDRRPRA